MAALRSAGYRTADDTQGFVAVESPPPAAPPIAPPPRRASRRRAVLGVALASLLAGGAYGVHAMAAGDPPESHLPTVQGEKGRGETEEPPRAWQVSMPSRGENNTPACSYAGHALYCNAPGVKASRLDPADGATVWSKEASGLSRRAGQDRTPVLSGGLLQVVAPGGERLEALDPKSGAKRWSIGISTYPTILHTARSVLLVTADGTVEAVSNTTGRTRWTERRGGLGTQWVASDGGGPALSVTPSADGTSSTVGAVDPDSGAVLWEERLDGMLGPVAASGGALFLLAYDTDSLTNAVVRLDIAPGARTARRVPLVTPVDQAQAAVHGDTAYVFGAGGSLLAVDTRRTGGARDAQRWRLETSVSRASQPVATRDRVYLAAADGRLLAVDAADGALLGQSEPRMDGGRQTFTPTLPAPVAVGEKVFATAPDGSVFAVDARDPAGW
ncbi:PQQ-binding-like beta-propeller repeat protein [Streptomyces sp. A5-4]|uniref:outer membrane protein assembly factor BamB family protein n=1 Tax=Streptomyces sp. A5-4 TaxID=3384771 RepID=UPI003DA9392E